MREFRDFFDLTDEYPKINLYYFTKKTPPHGGWWSAFCGVGLSTKMKAYLRTLGSARQLQVIGFTFQMPQTMTLKWWFMISTVTKWLFQLTAVLLMLKHWRMGFTF